MIFGKIFKKSKKNKDNNLTSYTGKNSYTDSINFTGITYTDANPKPSPNPIIPKENNEPYVELTGIVESPNGEIKIALDWNDSFIKHLKSNGFTGADDDVIIQKYLLELTSMISDDMKGDSDYE